MPRSVRAKMCRCVDGYKLPREGVNVRRGVGILRRLKGLLSSLPNYFGGIPPPEGFPYIKFTDGHNMA